MQGAGCMTNVSSHWMNKTYKHSTAHQLGCDCPMQHYREKINPYCQNHYLIKLYAFIRSCRCNRHVPPTHSPCSFTHTHHNHDNHPPIARPAFPLHAIQHNGPAMPTLTPRQMSPVLQLFMETSQLCDTHNKTASTQ